MSTTDVPEYRYSAAENPSGETGERLSQVIMERIINQAPSGAVCELGCGNGFLAGMLGKAGRCVLGVDTSASGIQIARQHHGAHAEFLCEPIGESLVSVLGRERFGVVVSSEVIEHLYRPADLLQTAWELLEPGGLLLLTTPYHGYLKNLAITALGKCDSHMDPLWDGGHIKFFSVKTLGRLVTTSGFTQVEFSFFGRMPFLWMSMICTARKAGRI